MESIKKVQEDKDLYEKLNDLHGMVYDAYQLEKQGEQKSSEMVKPKFKVGDWCIDNEDDVIFQIVKVLDNTYIYKTNEGKEYSCTHYSLENDARLWIIQDAKDGDVLAESKGNAILMFRGIGYHCYYDCYRKDFIVQKDVEYWGNTENNQLVPATKEQRDALMKAMTEAGYEWDAEKRELIKVIKIKNSNSVNVVKNYQINDLPKWCEEDDKIFNSLDIVLFEDKNMSNEKYWEIINWIRSLKQRIEKK